MSAKTELFEITRDLREYLEWHAQAEAAGSVPASSEQRLAFEALKKRREDRKLAEARRELMEEEEQTRTPEKQARTAETTKQPANKAATTSSEATSGDSDNPAADFRDRFNDATKEKAADKPAADDSDDQPWKRLGSRPKPRFAGGKKSKKASKPNERADEEPKMNDDTKSNQPPGPQYDENAYPEASGMMAEGPVDMGQPSPAAPEQPSKQKPEKATDDMSNAEKLEFLVEYLGDCRRCGLCENRTNIVFGDGSADAKLVFVGEAPGYNEDKQGLPFVGDAGQLLNKMINAMGLEREDVYICNVIKCRPPKNRNPHPDEIQECSPFLRKQLQVISPRVIVSLGKFASQFLLESDDAMGRMRGKWHEWEGIPVMPTYHPAYLLRQENQKGKTWNDLQMVMERLGL